MSDVNVKTINDARFLVHDILSESTDTIEKGLSRTGNIITGVVLGLLTFGVPAVIFFSDATTDQQKLKKIEAELIDLKKAELDNNSPDYQVAISARDFQKGVYENVKKYTLVAKKIKEMTGIGFIVYGVGTIMYAFNKQAQSPNLNLAATIAVSSGLLLSIPSLAYGLYHWIREGNKLKSTEQALATQVKGPLSA